MDVCVCWDDLVVGWKWFCCFLWECVDWWIELNCFFDDVFEYWKFLGCFGGYGVVVDDVVDFGGGVFVGFGVGCE